MHGVHVVGGSNPLAPTIDSLHSPFCEHIMSLSQTQPTSYFGLTIPFLDFIGVVPDFAENGKSRICLDLRPEHLNSFQVGHGGLSMTLLDFAMAAAARSVHPDAKGMVTIDMTVSFMRPIHRQAHH
jgi:acyl-coenzyme A thioesterase PaaI-like protein